MCLIRPYSIQLQNPIRYDTRCYFNVRSKADMSEIDLLHGNQQLKSGEQKKTKNGYVQKYR